MNRCVIGLIVGVTVRGERLSLEGLEQRVDLIDVVPVLGRPEVAVGKDAEDVRGRCTVDHGDQRVEKIVDVRGAVAVWRAAERGSTKDFCA